MIKITRPPAPDFLTDPNGLWVKEIERAKNHYKKKKVAAFKFKLFNNPRVKNALKEIFKKCAYCDASYGAVFDGDVEHFRPKGRIKEKKPQTPGYYWLANDWDNLFLACQHCNQRRKHLLYGVEKLEGYGKLDQFPLEAEEKRISKPGTELKDEEPARLLVNPCIDDPAEHFAYESTEAVVVPLTKKGVTSVNVYVLQRVLLVQERKKIMTDVLAFIQQAKEALESNNAMAFKNAYDNMIRLTADDRSFAGMCRFFVDKFLAENKIKKPK